MIYDYLDIVSEGYVGRTKNTDKIEKAVQKMISKYGSDSLVKVSMSNLDNSFEKHEIEKAIKDEFGFKNAFITIFNKTELNAYTAPTSMLVREVTSDMPSRPIRHGEKFYDKKHHYYFYMAMYAEDFSGYLTPGEITAMILHEVGHNFDVTYASWICEFISWAVSISPLGILFKLFNGELLHAIDAVYKAIDSFFPLTIAFNSVNKILETIGELLGPFGAALQMREIVRGIGVNPLNIPLSFLKFHSEKYADSFAAAYGYGPETISLMDKLERNNNFRGTFIESWAYSSHALSAFLMMVIDCHPETQTRCRLVLDDMERLSNDPNVPKPMKQEIAKEYQRTKKMYDEYLKVPPESREAIAIKLNRHLKEKVFRGKIDIRNYLYTTTALSTPPKRG